MRLGWWWCNLISGKQERPQEKVGFDHRAEGATWVSEQVLQTEGTAIVKALKAGRGGAKGVFEEQWGDPWDCSRVNDGERGEGS